MSSELEKEIRSFLIDMDLFSEDLEMMDMVYGTSLDEHEADDLVKIIKFSDKLETDVIIMEADCVTLMGQTYQNNRTWEVFDGIHLSFLTLEKMLNEIKKMRNLLENLSTLFDAMKLSDTDLDRLRKAINLIRKDMLNVCNSQDAMNCPAAEQRGIIKIIVPPQDMSAISSRAAVGN